MRNNHSKYRRKAYADRPVRANRKTAWQMWSLESYTDEDLLQSKKELEENIEMTKEWRERDYARLESETSMLEKNYISEDLLGYADSIHGDEIHIQQIEEELRSRGIHTSHRANRKRASERMNYGDVYTVHSDGSITVESIGDMEWVSVHVHEEEMNNDYMYDWDAIEAELYEGVASSTWGAEPVEAVPGYFISSMSSGVDVDILADLGPGEYRLCPVSLSYWVGEGEFSDLEHDDGFDYNVVVRY